MPDALDDQYLGKPEAARDRSVREGAPAECRLVGIEVYGRANRPTVPAGHPDLTVLAKSAGHVSELLEWLDPARPPPGQRDRHFPLPGPPVNPLQVNLVELPHQFRGITTGDDDPSLLETTPGGPIVAPRPGRYGTAPEILEGLTQMHDMYRPRNRRKATAGRRPRRSGQESGADRGTE